MKISYKVIGVMSGTSLDGLDVALCRFDRAGEKWHFEIIRAETFEYDAVWNRKLTSAHQLPGSELIIMHKEYGRYIGETVKKFIVHDRDINFIASHGHTIFHEPLKGVSFQLGDGSAIAASSGITTISDFRALDVALGGQGAPMVPIGDELLFGEFALCINLGGFVNVSNRVNDLRVACDLCPANIVINRLALKKAQPFDRDGLIARKGNINKNLFDQLEKLDFYKMQAPKSLGKEWLDKEFMPVLTSANLSIEDQLRTVYEHIVSQIVRYTSTVKGADVFITGGGAFNKFLIELLKKKSKHTIMIPDKQLVKFKEALVFAFLGVLRFRGEVNSLASVTGASNDSSGGVIHLIH